MKKIVLFFFFCLLLYSKQGSVYGVYRKEGIQNFPKSYQPYLLTLQEKYPNWSFTALYTELDWNDVIEKQNVFGKNLVPLSYSDTWKNTKPGEYNVNVDSRFCRLLEKSAGVYHGSTQFFA